MIQVYASVFIILVCNFLCSCVVNVTETDSNELLDLLLRSEISNNTNSTFNSLNSTISDDDIVDTIFDYETADNDITSFNNSTLVTGDNTDFNASDVYNMATDSVNLNTSISNIFNRKNETTELVMGNLSEEILINSENIMNREEFETDELIEEDVKNIKIKREHSSDSDEYIFETVLAKDFDKYIPKLMNNSNIHVTEHANGSKVLKDVSRKKHVRRVVRKPDQTSLVIVFDGTGSMENCLIQLRSGAKLIIEKFAASNENPIYNYVFVPFRDPRK